MKHILFVNACVKRDKPSRTMRLAQAYLSKQSQTQAVRIDTIVLEGLNLAPLTGEGLAAREKAIHAGDFSGEMFALARNFITADEVVIAAPYWDMSFPALLKVYLEQLCVNKLTFCYGDKGMLRSLAKVKKVVYITTAGGMIGVANFGFDYVKGLFAKLFNVTDFAFWSAEGLDIAGNDPEALLQAAIATIA